MNKKMLPVFFNHSRSDREEKVNTLVQSMANARETANSAPTQASSLNKVVDLFFQIAAMRSQEDETVIKVFDDAFKQNPEQTLKVLFWARDVRQGQGERRVFRVIIKHLASSSTSAISDLIHLIPTYGRWDDVLVFIDTPCEAVALDVISSALKSGDALCAKWMPREKSSKKIIAYKIRKFMGLSSRVYRKLLSSATKVVETSMCANEWDGIEYQRVPSQAMNIYKGAFERHSPEVWKSYMDALSSGEKKVSAGAIYPHQILAPYIELVCENNPIPEISQYQWAALPNWLVDNPFRILPIVDTSGSMYSSYSDSASIRPIDVSVSLGLYIAERNTGPFKNHFVTFSEKPKMQSLSGESLSEKLASVVSADWGYNTDIVRTFSAILHHAMHAKVTARDMPDMILILSDMEFDPATNYPNETAMQSIHREYDEAGYELPKVVFWNLNARPGNVPVAFDKSGTALVSGFSPSIMKSLLMGGEFTPESIMLKTILDSRYESILVA